MTDPPALRKDLDTFADFFVCFELAPPTGSEQDVVRAALTENPSNALVSSGALNPTIPDFDSGNTDQTEGSKGDNPLALALQVGKFWANGRTLNVRFLGGSAALQARIKKHAQTWCNYANITFSWDQPGPAQIRIAFKPGGGSWSYVGTVNESIDDFKPTMNFGWLKDSSTDQEVRRVVLHEFGHALGCVHEHQSPLTTIQWNLDKVYSDCAKPPNNWSREVTDHNVVNRLRADEVSTRKFDLDSIMLYQYPGTWITNMQGQGTNLNTALSTEDKEWISHAYPAYPMDIGAFSTLQTRAWNNTEDADDYQDVSFTPAYEIAPKLALGLTWIDLDCNADLSISASASDIANDGFRVAMKSDANSRLFTGGCAWLESAYGATDLQIGTVDLARLGDSPDTRSSKTEIRFPSAFDADDPPQVIVWFSALSLSKDHDWSVNVSPKKISNKSFTLTTSLGDDTVLTSATVTWLAYPSSRTDAASGVVSVGGSTADASLTGISGGTVEFPNAGYREPPQVMMAISGFNFAKGKNLRMRLGNSVVTGGSMNWFIESWLDSVMYGAQASWIAIERKKPGQ